MQIPHKLVLLVVTVSTIFFVAGLFLSAHAESNKGEVVSDSVASSTPAHSHEHHRHKSDILHLDKDRASEYKTVNPSYYEHSGVLGGSAALLVIILLGWVYHQNHEHDKRTRQDD